MRRLYSLVFVLLLVAACSPRSSATQTAAPTVSPTSILPTHAFQQPTEAPAIATAAAATRTAVAAAPENALDPQAVERGKGRYDALECGTCHGANGEGTDDGSPLVGTTLDEEAFITFLRTGGTIGNDHLYSTNRLSESGGRNLYQYILSLSAE
jgi:mono/diheme cytochrome c family protein